MKSFLSTMSAVVLAAVAGVALAETPGLPELDFCDSLLVAEQGEQAGDEEVLATKTRRFDLETSEVLTTEAAIMDALYEEKWDPATGAEIERRALCGSEPSYVVHWAELMSRDDTDALFPVAKGLMSFHRDGTFRFMFSKRPYDGSWALEGTQMRISAPWLDQGRPLVVPVERVQTPVEVQYSDGRVPDRYDEDVFRVGYFRLLPIDTTLKGQLQDCKCQ